MDYICKIILKTFIFPARSQLPCGPICLQFQAMLLSSPWYLCTSSWSSSPAHNHYSRVRIWWHVSQVTCNDMVSVHLCSKIILQAARAGSVTLVEVHLWVNCNVLEKPLQYIQYLRQVLHWLWRGLYERWYRTITYLRLCNFLISSFILVRLICLCITQPPNKFSSIAFLLHSASWSSSYILRYQSGSVTGFSRRRFQII